MDKKRTAYEHLKKHSSHQSIHDEVCEVRWFLGPRLDAEVLLCILEAPEWETEAHSNGS